MSDIDEPTEDEEYAETLREAALDDGLAAENPRYGPGNPDWERDFEKTGDET